MADITYCANSECPFKDCMRHITKATGMFNVSVASLDGTCRRYIRWLAETRGKDGAEDAP